MPLVVRFGPLYILHPAERRVHDHTREEAPREAPKTVRPSDSQNTYQVRYLLTPIGIGSLNMSTASKTWRHCYKIAVLLSHMFKNSHFNVLMILYRFLLGLTTSVLKSRLSPSHLPQMSAPAATLDRSPLIQTDQPLA